MDKILQAFNEAYVGKEFVYKSKYGRTKGVVQSIYSSASFIIDEDSENMLLYAVDHSVKGTKTKEKPEPKGTVKYMATQPNFHIRSTNGVTYDLIDCYFID